MLNDDVEINEEQQEELIDEQQKAGTDSEYLIQNQTTMSFSIESCFEIDQEISDPESYYNNKFIYEKVVKYLKEISHLHDKYNYIRDLSIEFIEMGSLVLFSDKLYKVEYVFDDDSILIFDEKNDFIKLVNKSELMPNDDACKRITNNDIQFLFNELILKFTITHDKDTIYDVFVAFSNYMKIDVKKIFKSLDDKIQKNLISVLNKRI